MSYFLLLDSAVRNAMHRNATHWFLSIIQAYGTKAGWFAIYTVRSLDIACRVTYVSKSNFFRLKTLPT